VVKLSDTRDYCQDIFNQWCYCFNCRYETSSANSNAFVWKECRRNRALDRNKMCCCESCFGTPYKL